jgi:hypothetical protein
MAVKLHGCPSRFVKMKAIEFEDGSWYREESPDMERTSREGRLLERQAQAG